MSLRSPQTHATEPHNFPPYNEDCPYPKALLKPDASHKQDQVFVNNAEEEEALLADWDDQFGKSGKHRKSVGKEFVPPAKKELSIEEICSQLEEAGVKVGKKWTDEEIRMKYDQLLEQKD